AAMPAWEGVLAAAAGAYAPLPNADQPRLTRLHIASCFGAFAGAIAIVMALIARERDGHGQRLEVPLFDATFLAIGASGLLVNGAPAGSRPDDAFSGTFRCLDGRWVRLSLSTPRFCRRFLDAAGKRSWIEAGYLEPGRLPPGSPERTRQQAELRDLFQTRTAEAWEQFGAVVDVPIHMVRTQQEWLAADHARQAGIIVPVEDARFGDMRQVGPAVRLEEHGPVQPPELRPPVVVPGPPSRQRAGTVGVAGSAPSQFQPPLHGLKAIDLSQVLAGPTAGRTLAEFGAEVVKINSPREEGAGYRWSVHRYHTDVNRGKATILLDLKAPEGREVFWRLVDDADVVLHTFRMGVAERLGVGYQQVKARRPGIIYATVSAFGYGGPWERWPGYEPHGQAVTGMSARQSGLGQPVMAPFAVNDYGTGLLTAFGVALALFQRERTGIGQQVEGALARTASVLQIAELLDYPGKLWEPSAREPAGTMPQPGPNATSTYADTRGRFGWGPLQRLYRAGDGRWFFLGCSGSQAASLAGVLGLAPVDAQDEERLEQLFATKPCSDWVDLLAQAGLGVQPVLSVPALMADAWALERGLSIRRLHPSGEDITTIGPPYRLSRTPAIPGRPAAPPGADAAELLRSIGMEQRLHHLLAKRVVVTDFESST
ncbi:MAG: CoA transferase, partial [Chloroflexota bacterium]|nr:CoA transferase [Chloroflexota bacterium]